MEKKESILQLFPDTYRSFFKEVIKQSEQIHEIRMRADRPIIVIWNGQEYFLTASGAFTKEEKLAMTEWKKRGAPLRLYWKHIYEEIGR